MAKGKPNKSDAIREILATNPDVKAREVVESLAAKGMEVTANLVYFLKGEAKEKKHRKTRVVRAARAATSNSTATGNVDAISMIREVKALAHKAGGYEKLKELVDALSE